MTTPTPGTTLRDLIEKHLGTRLKGDYGENPYVEVRVWEIALIAKQFLLDERPAEETTVLQAVLDAISGKLDPSTQIADHPNVKFAQMQRLKLLDERPAEKDDGIRFDAETGTYVARHTILTAGRNTDEAAAALASAIQMTAKHWPVAAPSRPERTEMTCPHCKVRPSGSGKDTYCAECLAIVTRDVEPANVAERGAETTAQFSEYERIAHQMCRKAGCKCSLPLLGWTEQNTPRCRLCCVVAASPLPRTGQEDLRVKIEKLERIHITGPDGRDGGVWLRDVLALCADPAKETE